MPDGSTRKIGITRLHLEQDAGKSLHDQHPTQTYVDLNRAGIGLMEIVSEPDLRSAEEAGIYLRKLRSILRYLGTCDGNMEEGSLRCDCNVSVRRPGEPYGTRCEIKNLNSVRFVMQAIEIEARRQVELIEDGGTVEQQTRLYDSGRGVTRRMRSKEHDHDYRYFPDPDLLPLQLEPEWLDRLRAELPELPDAKKARFVADFGLRPRMPMCWSPSAPAAEYFEQVADGRDPKAAANWVMGDLFGALNRLGLDIEQSPVAPERLGALIDLIAERHDLRPHRQGRVRRNARNRRRARTRSSKPRACARSATPARSRPRSTPRSPPTRPRSRNTRPTRRCSASSSAR